VLDDELAELREFGELGGEVSSRQMYIRFLLELAMKDWMPGVRGFVVIRIASVGCSVGLLVVVEFVFVVGVGVVSAERAWFTGAIIVDLRRSSCLRSRWYWNASEIGRAEVEELSVPSSSRINAGMGLR